VFDLSTAGSGCLLTVHLTDNIKTIGKTWGVNRQYREIFDEVRQRVDLALARLDGAAAAAFGEPRFWSRSAEINVLEESTRITAKAVGGAVGAAGKVLHRRPPVQRPRPGRRRLGHVYVIRRRCGPDSRRYAGGSRHRGHDRLASGAMPAALTRDVETFAASVEQKLTAAGDGAARWTSRRAQPVFEFSANSRRSGLLADA